MHEMAINAKAKGPISDCIFRICNNKMAAMTSLDTKIDQAQVKYCCKPKACKLMRDLNVRQATLQISYVQIHEDSIKDLLADLSVTPRMPSITLREAPGKGVYMENVR